MLSFLIIAVIDHAVFAKNVCVSLIHFIAIYWQKILLSIKDILLRQKVKFNVKYIGQAKFWGSFIYTSYG